MPAQRRDAHVRWYLEDCMPFVTHPSVTHVPSLKCHLCTRLYSHRCRLHHRDTREAPTEAVTARRSNWPHAAVTIPRTMSSRLTGASGAKKRVSVASVRCGRWRCGVAHSVMRSTVMWRYTPGSGRRVHHAGGGDRPDPRPPPRPPCDDGPRRRAEFPIDAGPPRTEVRHAPPARPPTPRPPHEYRPPTPRDHAGTDHAGTVGMRGSRTGASDWSPPALATPR